MRPSRCLSILFALLARCDGVTQLATDWAPQVIAVDSQAVYWATTSLIKTAPINGGPSQTIATISVPDPYDYPHGLAFDGSALYYGSCRVIMRLRFFDQVPAEVAARVNECVRALTVNGESIFWATFENKLYRMPKSGGDSVPIFEGSRVACMVADDTGIYWTAAGTIMGQAAGSTVLLGSTQDVASCNMVLDADYIYWVSAGDGSVIRVQRNGAGWQVLATGQHHMSDIAVDDASIYWTTLGEFDIQLEDYAGGTIWRLSKSLTAPPREIVSQPDPRGLLLTEKQIYWSTAPHQRMGGVFRRPK